MLVTTGLAGEQAWPCFPSNHGGKYPYVFLVDLCCNGLNAGLKLNCNSPDKIKLGLAQGLTCVSKCVGIQLPIVISWIQNLCACMGLFMRVCVIQPQSYKHWDNWLVFKLFVSVGTHAWHRNKLSNVWDCERGWQTMHYSTLHDFKGSTNIHFKNETSLGTSHERWKTEADLNSVKDKMREHWEKKNLFTLSLYIFSCVFVYLLLTFDQSLDTVYTLSTHVALLWIKKHVVMSKAWNTERRWSLPALPLVPLVSLLICIKLSSAVSVSHR